MKFIISLCLIVLVSFAACLYFPWWIIALTSFVVCAIIPQNPLMSFSSGFCALFLLWGTLAWAISNSNNHILAHKISLLVLKADNPGLLVLVTALIGAIVAGFAATAGSYLRKLLTYQR